MTHTGLYLAQPSKSHMILDSLCRLSLVPLSIVILLSSILDTSLAQTRPSDDGHMVTRQGQSKNNIPVNILITPAHYLHGKNYIATGVNFTAEAEILDVKFKNASIEYQWSVKNKTFTGPSKIVYKFDKPDPDNFLELLVFHRPNDTGISNKSFVIRDPVVIPQRVGHLFLEHGELLDVKLNFSGTSPFRYCHKVCWLGEQERKDKSNTCECSPDKDTSNNEINIVKYLHSVGNYSLVVVVDNVASQAVKDFTVKITEILRPKKVPYVPIVSSILAVIILLSGVALHLRFRQTIITETADFDFIRHDYNDDEFWDEEQSFLQRVRYLFFQSNIDHDGSMTDSNLSGAIR